jgi:octaprenyl-diphosphate synthase
MRRGQNTANSIFGNAASVLVGDFIYTRSFQLMIESNSLELLQVMANSTNQISEGEVLQLLNIGNSELDEVGYFKIIEAKTSILFEASAKVASIISNATTSQKTALTNYAINLGIAFQIIDDILDYIGDSNTLGKNLGDDLLEGKITLPLIHILKNGDKSEIDLIKNSIKYPKDADLNTIIQLINKNNSITYCKAKANHYIDVAIRSLEIFPQSDIKNIMVQLANMSINRIN